MKNALIVSFALVASIPFVATALTVRSKSDFRLWETVTDRASPLAWSWEADADSALLTFSNRLTHVVTFTNVVRTAGMSRGACEHPVTRVTDEGLFDALLVQMSGGVEIEREAALLAYPQGVAAQPITVRTKADRDWWRVHVPRAAGFDAAWWGENGPSGYEVLWRQPSGWYRVERTFAGVGVVDEVLLRFGDKGLLMIFR